MIIEELKNKLLYNIENHTYSPNISNPETAVNILQEVYAFIDYNMPDGGTWEHWMVGCIDSPERKRAELNNPRHWKAWDCESKELASYLRWLIDKEMHTQGGRVTAPPESKYIYCYLDV